MSPQEPERIRPRQSPFSLQSLIERHGLKCCWCGRTCDPSLSSNADLYPTREHLIRRCDGGKNTVENLRIACRKCNGSRHSLNWEHASKHPPQVLEIPKPPPPSLTPRKRKYAITRHPSDPKLLKRFMKRQAKRLGVGWTTVPLPTRQQMLALAAETGWYED